MAQELKENVLKKLSFSISKLFGSSNSAQQSVTGPSTYASHSSSASSTAPISYQFDYAKTLFLNAHKNVSAIKPSSEYNRYFYYECGIQDAATYHLSLLKQEYLRLATLEEKLQTLTVPALKDIAVTFELQPVGKKADLISRIVELDRRSDIENRLPYQVYTVLTEKGSDFLAEHNDYVLLHRHKDWGVNWQEYDKRKKGHSFYDVVWGFFNERLSENMQSYSRGGSAERYYCEERNIRLNMFDLLQEEGKVERALAELIHVLYIDTSGVTGLQSILTASKALSSKQVELYLIYFIPVPGIIKSFSNFQAVTKDKVLANIDRCFDNHLPLQICSKELFTQIVLSSIDGSYDNFKVNESLTQSFLAYLRIK